MNDIVKKFSENLKRIREEKKISRRQLAAKIGIEENSVGAYERGTREPNISRIIQLTEILGITINDLIETPMEAKKSIIDQYRTEKAIETAIKAGYLPFVQTKGSKKIVLRLSYPIIDRTGYAESGKELTDDAIKIDIQYKDFSTTEEFVRFIESVENYAICNNLSFQKAFKKSLRPEADFVIF